MEQLQISAKVLGGMALPDFCPRCMWIRMKCKPLPFQIFPGIFSSIDAYTKKCVRAMIDRGPGKRPAFLDTLGVTGYVEKVPTWRTFKMEAQGVMLTGIPDDIFTTQAGEVIPDHKTAKLTKNQDKLLPMYNIQLNGYAKIRENETGKRIRALPLIYWEPQTDEPDAIRNVNAQQFTMEFNPAIHMVPRDIESVNELIEKAREIWEMLVPPIGTEGCKDCAALWAIQDLTIDGS